MKNNYTDLTIVIPCRAGSTRVKNKNFKPFSNTTLLENKVKQAKTLNAKIVINSDSVVAKQIAEDNGIEFIQRPAYYASSECINSEYYDYLGNSVDTKYIMILQPTAPLIKDATVKSCVDSFYDNIDEYDSLVTADYSKKFAWYNGKPINYDVANMPNSQDLDPIIMPTYNVMICKVSELLKAKNVMTPRCLLFEVSDLESIEIDTPLEFEIAEILYDRNK
jgi:CMP-N-acetylneuraminic acid synthetase